MVRPEITIEQISASDTHALRLAVLRPGASPADVLYPGDETAIHFGARHLENLVGIASIYREAMPVGKGQRTGIAWRLRGMATLPTVRGQGIGARLLAACMEQVAVEGGSLLWCNARVAAAGFYLRSGFQVIGDVFEIPQIGPHYVMWRTIGMETSLVGPSIQSTTDS